MVLLTKQNANESLTGSFRRFGENGILYQVLDELDGESVKILVLETGEEVVYSKQAALADPTN